MSPFKTFLASLPHWLLTGITLAAILWLTLAPDPLNGEGPQLFDGADKVVHAIMFGFLTAMALLDWQRVRQWAPVPAMRDLLVAAVCSLLGVAIEFMQLAMGMGRAFETADMAADTAGAYIFGLAFLALQGRWSR